MHNSNQSHANRSTQGQQNVLHITISLEDSYYGVNKEIEIDNFKICQTCKGKGGEHSTCPICHGSGTFIQQNGFMTIQTMCNNCGGSGKIISKKCNDCQGSGYTSSKEKMTISIPQGVISGMKLRVANKGFPGKNGRTKRRFNYCYYSTRKSNVSKK
jgi:molecular chaperone DnaJ